MKCLCREIIIEVRKRINEFFHPSVESIMNRFAIVEKKIITQEEFEEFLKILDEWKV